MRSSRRSADVSPPWTALVGHLDVEDVGADAWCTGRPTEDKPNRCSPNNREYSFQNCEAYNADCYSDGSVQRNP